MLVFSVISTAAAHKLCDTLFVSEHIRQKCSHMLTIHVRNLAPIRVFRVESNCRCSQNKYVSVFDTLRCAGRCWHWLFSIVAHERSKNIAWKMRRFAANPKIERVYVVRERRKPCLYHLFDFITFGWCECYPKNVSVTAKTLEQFKDSTA